MLSPAHREVLGRSSGPAERPEERKGRLDQNTDGKKAPEAHAVAASLETPDHLAPSPRSCGTAPGPLGELVPNVSAQGCPCSPASTSSVMPQSSAPALPLKAQEPPQEPGPEEQVPPGASSGGLRPHTPEPTTARHGLHHPAKPPRSKATKGPGQDPQGPPPASLGPSVAKASPDSPRGAPGSHPEQPRPADRKLCLSSVDALPVPKSTACPSLQEATRLIQEEFAFDGYLDNGLEALIMGTGGHGGQETPQDQGEAGSGHGARGEGHHKEGRTLHEEPVSRARPPGVLGSEEGLRAQLPSHPSPREQPHSCRK